MSGNQITVPMIVEKIKAYVSINGNLVGGNLYMVLSNNNILDDNIKFCSKQASEQNDQKGIELCNLLLKASKTQRLKACNSW